MGNKSERGELRIGEYFLDRGRNSPNYYVFWFDRRTRQTVSVSLGTPNLEQAKLEFAKWVTINAEMRSENPQDVHLATIFERYYEHHAKHVVGAGVQQRNLYLVLKAAGNIMVSSYNLETQERIVRELAEAGYAPGTRKRILSAPRAALNWAWKRGHIASIPPFISLPDSPPRERILTIEEMAALWDAAESEHVRLFFLLAIGTAARPSAILELTTFQCDFDRRIIDLNPPARPQTRKRRPVVPMSKILQMTLSRLPVGHIVRYRDKPLKKINAGWRNMRDGAALDRDVNPYSIRHHGNRTSGTGRSRAGDSRTIGAFNAQFPVNRKICEISAGLPRHSRSCY